MDIWDSIKGSASEGFDWAVGVAQDVDDSIRGVVPHYDDYIQGTGMVLLYADLPTLPFMLAGCADTGGNTVGDGSGNGGTTDSNLDETADENISNDTIDGQDTTDGQISDQSSDLDGITQPCKDANGFMSFQLIVDDEVCQTNDIDFYKDQNNVTHIIGFCETPIYRTFDCEVPNNSVVGQKPCVISARQVVVPVQEGSSINPLFGKGVSRDGDNIYITACYDENVEVSGTAKCLLGSDKWQNNSGAYYTNPQDKEEKPLFPYIGSFAVMNGYAYFIGASKYDSNSIIFKGSIQNGSLETPNALLDSVQNPQGVGIFNNNVYVLGEKELIVIDNSGVAGPSEQLSKNVESRSELSFINGSFMCGSKTINAPGIFVKIPSNNMLGVAYATGVVDECAVLPQDQGDFVLASSRNTGAYLLFNPKTDDGYSKVCDIQNGVFRTDTCFDVLRGRGADAISVGSDLYMALSSDALDACGEPATMIIGTVLLWN